MMYATTFDKFTMEINATEKHCNVCNRPGVYVVKFPMLTVRFCWFCLPAEQRHYLRVNY